MLGILLAVSRYLLLFLLYMFILKLVLMMFREYREILADSKRKKEKEEEISMKKSKVLASMSKNNKDDAFIGSRDEGEASLMVLESSDELLKEGDVFPVHGQIYLGRSQENEIILENPFASAVHARIYLEKGQFWVEDLESINGTFLNDHMVKKPVVLVNGDMIRIGGVVFKYVRWTL